MSLALTGDTIAYMMSLGLSAEQMKGLVDRLNRDAQAMAPPASINGVNEERERLRNESTYAERKRAKDRERQRQIRDIARQSRDPGDNRATSTATEGDSPATTGDAAAEPSRTQVVIPSLPSLRSEEVGVVGGGEREPEPKPDDWPRGNGPHLAKLLVEAVESPWLDPAKSLDLHTSAGRLAAWKRDGASWDHDVLPVVRALCAKRRGRISSWKYFDEAVSRSIAENRAALEIPEAGSVRATGPPNITDRIAADRAEARRRVLES